MRTDRILIALLLLIEAAGCATKYQADRDIGVAHQEIRRAEEDWAKAIRDRDSLSLERHLAPGFFVQSIAPDRPATSVDRAQWLANTMKLRLDAVRQATPAQRTAHRQIDLPITAPLSKSLEPES